MPETCEVPLQNVSGKETEKILSNSRTVAVVGLSDSPDRDSYRVASYLKNHGYRVIPVNPNVKEVLGEKAYPSLGEIPEKIDIVDIFRKPAFYQEKKE